MSIRKTGIAIAVGALLMSGSVWADNDSSNDAFGSDDLASHNDVLSDNETNLLSDNTTTTIVTDASDNSDMSTNDSNNDVDLLSNNDTETNLLSGNETETNLLSGNETETNLLSGNETTTSWTSNSWSSMEYTTEIDIDSDIVIASSDLEGTVTGNNVFYGSGGGFGFVNPGGPVSNSNSISGMDGAAGITTVAQISGPNSLVQQSVNTNASLFAGD